MQTRLTALTRHGIGVALLDAGNAHQSSPITVDEYPVRLPLNCLIADPQEDGADARLLVGTQGQGVWESRDGGATWNHVGLPGIIVKSLQRTPTRLLAGTKNPPLIYSSEDSGATWQEFTGFRNIPSRPLWFSPAEKPYTAYVMGVDQSPTAPAHLIAGMEAGAVVFSGDDGQNWTDHQPGAMRDCHAIGYHPHDGRYAYAVGGNSQGAALSRDGGATWINCRVGLEQRYAWSYAAHPNMPERWFVAAAPGPRQAHSDDGNAQAMIYRAVVPTGATNRSTASSSAANGSGSNQTGADPQRPTIWEPLHNGLPTPLPSMPYSLVIPHHQPDHIYAGLRNGAVYMSPDCGDHWLRLPLQFDGIRRTLLVEPAP